MEKLGDLCFDFAKLIFGGVILAAIMQLEINTAWLFTIGFVFVLLAVVFGCILFVLSNKKNKLLMGLIYFISAFGILMLVGIIWGIGELRKDASKR